MSVLHAPGELLDELVVAHRQRWTHSDELLALLLEKLDQLLIVTGIIWSDPKKRPPGPTKPMRYPRPHVANKRQVTSPIAKLRKFFSGR